jgi:hypothetical protein
MCMPHTLTASPPAPPVPPPPSSPGSTRGQLPLQRWPSAQRQTQAAASAGQLPARLLGERSIKCVALA